MEIIKIDRQSTIKVFGVEFHGVSQLQEYALRGEPKSGVFVGVDQLRYPCFDSEDYASEYRYYANFVFARSKQELVRKMSMLKSINGRFDHRKLTDNTPALLLPMAYFGGDFFDPLEISACQDVVIL